MILYSNDCPKCKILKDKLDNKGIEYDKVDDMEIFTKKGFRSMPMLDVGDNILEFGRAIKWINEM